MTVAATVILTRVRDTLIDPNGTRWVDTELLRWLNDGQRLIATAVPAATATRATLALVAGTVQQLPNQANLLLVCERNNGASNGSAPGRAVRAMTRDLLDNFNPDWHAATQTAVVQNYAYEPSNPKTFYVTPPNDGTGHLDVVYSALPTEITATNQAITVDDIYQTPLVDYVLYRALTKDADHDQNAGAMANGYLASFQAAVGVTAQTKGSGQ